MSGTYPEQEWFMTGSGPAHVRQGLGIGTVRVRYWSGSGAVHDPV